MKEPFVTYYKEESSGLMYVPNKDKLKCYRSRGRGDFKLRERTTKCDCGQYIAFYAKKHHEKTNKHIELLDPEKKKKYISCDCGEVVTPNNYKRHLKRQRHFMNLQKRSWENQSELSS